MGKGYLIDSNVIIDFFNKSLPENGRDLLFKIDPNISVVTFVEVLAKNNADKGEVEKIKRFCEGANIYNIDKSLVPDVINLRRYYKIKLPDALIAATALYNDLILVTRNVADFKNIIGLELINPYTI